MFIIVTIYWAKLPFSWKKKTKTHFHRCQLTSLNSVYNLWLNRTSEQKNIAPVKAKAKVAIQLQLSVSGLVRSTLTHTHTHSIHMHTQKHEVHGTLTLHFIFSDKSSRLRSTFQERSRVRLPWKLRMTLAVLSLISLELVALNNVSFNLSCLYFLVIIFIFFLTDNKPG